MRPQRLEAFSDGFIAIIITIMVLEMKVPHGTDWAALWALLPVFACYVVSFVFVAIYWNNHHHLLHTAKKVTGGILWANIHLLFWLSLIPFTTAWMGENAFAALPTASYGVVLTMAAFAYTLLSRVIIATHGGDSSLLRRIIGSDHRGMVSLFLYVAAIPTAFVAPLISILFYVTVAMMWIVPDRRIEQRVKPPAES